MATPALGPAKADVDSLIRTAQLPGISKAALQTICSVNGLAKGGNKADLQQRIINLINECTRNMDCLRFQEVSRSVYSHAPVQKPQSIYQPTSASTGMPSYNYQNGSAVNGHRPASQPNIQFKPSPFYEIKGRIGELRTCEAMSQYRHSFSISVRAQDHPAMQQCVTDPNTRVMVLCAAGNSGIQDISFPHQSELKVNGGEVKANLRGLKNKPGSTRPVDITNLLRLKPASYQNSVEFTYALTSKKYYLGLYACTATSLEGLVERIGKGKRIPKSSVVIEITKKANDPDVVATSQNISLKCPLSYMRLKNPCRGLNCSHIQCFDAMSYLQLQEQGPQWVCPICNKPAPFEQLAVDDYVKDILDSTPSTVEQVTIEPNGKWLVQGATDQAEEKPASPKATSFVDDDDLVISETTFVGNRNIATPSRQIMKFGGTPTRASTESSTAPRSATSSKRPVAEVIDLTLSDDEPEDRPTKRQNTSTNGWTT